MRLITIASLLFPVTQFTPQKHIFRSPPPNSPGILDWATEYRTLPFERVHAKRVDAPPKKSIFRKFFPGAVYHLPDITGLYFEENISGQIFYVIIT